MNRTKTVKPKVVELSSEDKAKQRKKLMAEFLAKGGKVEKCKPMKPTKEQLKSWKI